MVYSLRALALPYFSPRPFRIFCFLTTFTARQPFPSSPDCQQKNIHICEILLSLRELTTAMIETPSTDFCALFYCIFVLQFFHIFIGLAAVVVNKLWQICSNWFPHTESTQSSLVTRCWYFLYKSVWYDCWCVHCCELLFFRIAKHLHNIVKF